MSVASRRRQAADVGGHDAAVDTDPESLAAIAAAAKAPTPRRRQWVKTAMLVVAAFVIVRRFREIQIGYRRYFGRMVSSLEWSIASSSLVAQSYP